MIHAPVIVAVPRPRGARPRLRASPRPSPGRRRGRGRPGQRGGRMSSPTTSPPVDEIRIGSIKAAVWDYESEGEAFTTVSRSPASTGPRTATGEAPAASEAMTSCCWPRSPTRPTPASSSSLAGARKATTSDPPRVPGRERPGWQRARPPGRRASRAGVSSMGDFPLSPEPFPFRAGMGIPRKRPGPARHPHAHGCHRHSRSGALPPPLPLRSPGVDPGDRWTLPVHHVETWLAGVHNHDHQVFSVSAEADRDGVPLVHITPPSSGRKEAPIQEGSIR